MKYIISGTNRPGSNTLKIARLVQQLYRENSEDVELIDLAALDFSTLGGNYGTDPVPAIKQVIEKINTSDGLIFVVPEYNGSYPGILKYFIDFWTYPLSFEKRPVCFIGLGGMFGGLRPVEHLQQVFGYRNAFQFPERIFIQNVWKKFEADGSLNDSQLVELLKKQVSGFQKFTKQVRSAP